MYSHKDIDEKWQKRWEEEGLFHADDASDAPKYYALIEFPYPSGAGLHMGHPRSYTALDVIARKRRAEGFNVLYPIGWDAFGLPTENYAIKTGRKPQDVTAENVATYRRQLKSLGLSFDWSREVNTTDPEYYRWTQWMFLEFFKAGMAYKAKVPINWCVSCKIGLANEEVVGGACERCGGVVEKRDKEQWMIAITRYADRLLAGLETVDYLPKIRKQQEDWIGKSEGAEVDFVIASDPSVIASEAKQSHIVTVFTTRPDTLFGATYAVLAPEHPLVAALLPSVKNRTAVKKYIKEAIVKTDMDRANAEREKTGVRIEGVTAMNPVNGESLPVWVADYVMMAYGTGAIMAVPAHDERDFAFAKQFGLPVRQVVQSPALGIVPPGTVKQIAGVIAEEIRVESSCFSGSGIAINSNFLDGFTTAEAKERMTEWLEREGHGCRAVHYKLRDWVFSRQRYWGEPIPLVHCDACAVTDAVVDHTVHIFHGWMDSSASGFILALKSHLEEKGYGVMALDAPNTQEPQFAAWLAFGDEALTQSHNRPRSVVGHSMGGYLALKLAETHAMDTLVLVAPVGAQASDAYFEQFTDTLSADELALLRAYQNQPIDAQAVVRNVRRIVFVFSDDDPWITREIVEQYRAQFGDVAQFLTVHGQGHISQDSGCRRAPFVETLFDDLRAARDGWVSVLESALPVELPDVESYQPTDSGESPLATMTDWVETTCPHCGGAARRETDTMPNWAGSSWYFLRYADPHNAERFASPEALRRWMPVDWYNGGMEHTVLHLLYSRFWNQFLYDRGHVPTAEPYARRTSHGLILAADGSKMSKSKGNVVNPDEIVERYGADTLRVYELFIGPFGEAVPWSERGVVGVKRFLDRVARLPDLVAGEESEVVTRALHKMVKKVSEDVEAMRFNTAVAAMMSFVNVVYGESSLRRESLAIFLKVLHPFAPHLTDELYERTGGGFLMREGWPRFDEALVRDDMVTIGVQINGKVRGDVTLAVDATEAEARAAAEAQSSVARYLEGKRVRKFVYVAGRIVNFVVD